MNDLQIFENPEFGSVRTIELDGEPYFVGKDVTEILGYQNGNRDIIRHVDEEDRMMVDSEAQYQNGIELGQRGGWLINESGLYSLILKSKLPKAKEFKHWVTSEVLPSIRKHGTYMTPQTLYSALTKPENLIELLKVLKDEQDKNRELKAINAVLSEQACDWDNLAILNALVRAYAVKCCNSYWGQAWNALYKNLRYKEHINLKIRSGKSGKKNAKYIDFIRPEEMSTVVKIAAAMCEQSGINTSNIINEVNTRKIYS